MSDGMFRRRQAVRKLSKDGIIIRFRLCRAQGKGQMFQNRVMPLGKPSMGEKFNAVLEDVMKSLVMAVAMGCQRPFVHAIKKG